VTEAISCTAGGEEWLAPLAAVAGVRAGWLGRVPGIAVAVERDEAMRRLRPAHEQALAGWTGGRPWWRAEQVHGAWVAVVPGPSLAVAADGLPVVPGVDGLVTVVAGEVLAVYVADCGPLWLADRGSGAVGVLHSGRKGTEENILGEAVRVMGERFGTRPADLVAVLGPCIRPPHYEVDFAAEIARQAAAAGIVDFHDCGCDTAADPGRFYSYRGERGRTGRMLAWILRDGRGR
jgi:copper oxidase (laccase) domain-containing protein